MKLILKNIKIIALHFEFKSNVVIFVQIIKTT